MLSLLFKMYYFCENKLKNFEFKYFLRNYPIVLTEFFVEHFLWADWNILNCYHNHIRLNKRQNQVRSKS